MMLMGVASLCNVRCDSGTQKGIRKDSERDEGDGCASGWCVRHSKTSENGEKLLRIQNLVCERYHSGIIGIISAYTLPPARHEK